MDGKSADVLQRRKGVVLGEENPNKSETGSDPMLPSDLALSE